jgi:hypothetical protein
MKLKEVPFKNVTVGMLRQFEQDGIIAVADGDKKVFLIMPRKAVNKLQMESETLDAFLAALK